MCSPKWADSASEHSGMRQSCSEAGPAAEQEGWAPAEGCGQPGDLQSPPRKRINEPCQAGFESAVLSPEQTGNKNARVCMSSHRVLEAEPAAGREGRPATEACGQPGDRSACRVVTVPCCLPGLGAWRPCGLAASLLWSAAQHRLFSNAAEGWRRRS